jgi:hypothetical protein
MYLASYLIASPQQLIRLLLLLTHGNDMLPRNDILSLVTSNVNGKPRHEEHAPCDHSVTGLLLLAEAHRFCGAAAGGVDHELLGGVVAPARTVISARPLKFTCTK